MAKVNEKLTATIESDGTLAGTRVLLSNGQELANVTRVEFNADAGGNYAEATVWLGLAALHFTGPVTLRGAPSPPGGGGNH